LCTFSSDIANACITVSLASQIEAVTRTKADLLSLPCFQTATT
jgi:hypothetical protein